VRKAVIPPWEGNNPTQQKNIRYQTRRLAECRVGVKKDHKGTSNQAIFRKEENTRLISDCLGDCSSDLGCEKGQGRKTE